ncbi:MAG TPA: ABC transporter permease [Balneolaceae bacterium]
MKRNKSYTFINVGGLAVGFACCILIALYVRSELSHDDFYEYADRLVVIGKESSFWGKGTTTPYPLAGALEAEVPMVEKAVITLWPGEAEVSIDDQDYFEEDGVFHAGEDFFNMFSFPFIRGNREGALIEPNTAVISAELAEKYFPGENPIEQIIYSKKRGKQAYTITGVARSNDNSYVDFNAVLSLSTLDYAESHGDSWRSYMFFTYALLNEASDINELNKQFEAFVDRHYGKESKSGFFAQKISDFYLSDLSVSEGFSGQWLYVYLFSSVALFILLLACVNYINLSTARAAKRAREVGVRKTLGAGRSQIIKQFIGESVLMSSAAFIIALFLAYLILPAFNVLFGMNMTFSEAGFDWFVILAAIALIVGFLAGSYPAFYLSAFNPALVLKGDSAKGSSGSWLRKSLVIVQFIVAAALIIATVVVFMQLRYTQQKDLGFEGEQVVMTSVPGQGSKAFRSEIVSHPAILSATVSNAIPGRFHVTFGLYPQNLSPATKADTTESISFKPGEVDYYYIETLEMEMAAGRQFSEERTTDRTQAYMINEAAAKAMGWSTEEAVGKPFSLGSDVMGEVIGVVENFHIASFHQSIEPVALTLFDSESWSSPKDVAIRLASGHIQEGLRHIEEVRAEFTNEPFVYSFLDDEFAEMYREERRLAQVFGGFAAIAVLLACMGLFGLATFTAERRTKEIGIRKVMGATVSNIVSLLSKDFLKLVIIGFVIAVPLAWYFMQQWLQDFAYRIDIGVGIFLLAGALALFIALATVSWQSIRAAVANPVDSLRSE